MTMFFRNHFYCVFLGSEMYPFCKPRKFYGVGQIITVRVDKTGFTAMEHKVGIFLKPSLLAKLTYLLRAKVLIIKSNLPRFGKKIVVILTKFSVKLARSNGNMGRAGANTKNNREKKQSTLSQSVRSRSSGLL